MYKFRKFFLLIFVFTQTFTAFSQIAIGEWRTHFSYNMVNQVAYGENQVYVLANEKLFSYSPTDGIKTYTTITGLNGHNISFISWCESEKKLIIVYSDGNIDFLGVSGIDNLPDYKNKSITADKTVYGIRTEGSKAYLSTGVGLLIVDVRKLEISETFYMKFSTSYTTAYDVAAWGDSIVVATNSGLYGGNAKSNLLDASYWSPVPFISGLAATQIVRFNNQLLALVQNTGIFQKSSLGWSNIIPDPNVTSMSVQNGYLFVCANTNTYMYDTSMNLQDVPSILNNDITMNPVNNELYIASGSNGLKILTKKDSKYIISANTPMANGPACNAGWNGFFKDGVYYSTPGGRWGDRYFTNGDILVYKDEKWSNLQNKQDIKTDLPLMDFLNLAIDPEDPGHYFITSWGEGLYEFRDSVFYHLWNNKNSPLASSLPLNPLSNRYVRVDGATFDADNNLWVLCSNADSTIQILECNDGKYDKWSKLYYPEIGYGSTWNSILFTKNNQIWMNSAREKKCGIFVLEKKATLENTVGGNTRFFNLFTDQDGITINPYTFNCITEDLSGSIWIGTVFGPIIANNTSNIFRPDYNFTRIKIPRNDGSGNADYLLNDVRINCITVDGANRKWLGTNGDGLYLLSADGLKVIHHFTIENSPLPSAFIWSVAINPESGEVFIGTDAGLVSYRSDATTGATAYSNVHVFPNPVRPEYAGKITVTGLMENTQVKITDLSGNALITGTSLGGQFSWDGYTKQGKRAASGVYIVLCVSEDGLEYQACKFMIVN